MSVKNVGHLVWDRESHTSSVLRDSKGTSCANLNVFVQKQLECWPVCSQFGYCAHFSQSSVDAQAKGEGVNTALHSLLTFAGFFGGLASCPVVYKRQRRAWGSVLRTGTFQDLLRIVIRLGSTGLS